MPRFDSKGNFKQGMKEVCTLFKAEPIMGRPPKRQETETIEVTVPATLHGALVHLAMHTTFGATENAVAAYILAKEVERMQRAGEFGLKMPG